MQTSDIVKLLNAGFTKEEIMQLASPAQTQVQTPTLVQPQPLTYPLCLKAVQQEPQTVYLAP